MSKFEFEKLDLEGAMLITPFFHLDERGGFTKIFEKNEYQQAGIEFQLNESFVSISGKNVIRGIHFQLQEPQAKLVSVPKGKVYDIIVDLRIDSPTYKQWRGFYLGDDNHQALYIPKGFGHAFLSLEEQTYMLYQCDGAYDASSDTGIRFDDKEINIQWPVDMLDRCIYSDRDLKLMSLREYEDKIRQIKMERI